MRKVIVFIYPLLFFVLPVAGQEPVVEERPLTVEFSIEGGFYDEAKSVRLYSEGSQIYYTTNGNDPQIGRRDQLYTGPIRVDRTQVIRASASDGKRTSPIVAHTFFINEPTSGFPTVSVSIPPAVLFHPNSGLFVKGPNAVDSLWKLPGANFWSRVEVPVNVEIYETDGMCVFRNGAGFRLFGGMSRLFPQKSMAIVARDQYGQNRFRHRIFGEKGLKKFKFLVLRNSGSDFGKSHFRDCFMTSLVDDWDIEKQDYRPAHVYINGMYWGIYNIREKINRYFIAGHTDYHKDSIDLLEHRFTRKRGGKAHYLRMLDFIEKADLSDPANFAYLESQMEVQNYMDYQIAQIYFDNQDAGGNIRYWRPQTENGRWRWILYDTDWGYGLHDELGYENNSLSFHTTPDGPSWPNPPWSTLILRKLLENEAFAKAFVNRFADHLNTSFAEEQVLRVLKDFEDRYYPEMPRHFARWKLDSTTWESEIREMEVFAGKRPDYVRMHLMEKFNTGRERRLVLDVDPGGMVKLNDHLELEGGGFSGTYFEYVPVHLEAIPELGYRFSHWEGIAVDPGETKLSLFLNKGITEVRAVFEPFEHPLAGKVMINEVSCNNKEAGDWIEIYNYADEKIDLEGWMFTDTKHAFYFPELVLPAKDYLVVCEDAVAFGKVYKDAYRYIGDLGFGLDKRRENLGLFDPNGALVDSLRYDLEPQDSVFTLNLLLPHLDNADFDNWEVLPGLGTPNSANDYFVESTLRARRELWMEVGAAVGVILICIMLLILRRRGTV